MKYSSYYSFYVPNSNYIILITEACSHHRAQELYVESVYRMNNPLAFASKACDSYEDFEAGLCESNKQVPMGELLTPDM